MFKAGVSWSTHGSYVARNLSFNLMSATLEVVYLKNLCLIFNLFVCVRVHMQASDLLSTKTEKQTLLADSIIFSGNL